MMTPTADTKSHGQHWASVDLVGTTCEVSYCLGTTWPDMAYKVLNATACRRGPDQPSRVPTTGWVPRSIELIEGRDLAL